MVIVTRVIFVDHPLERALLRRAQLTGRVRALVVVIAGAHTDGAAGGSAHSGIEALLDECGAVMLFAVPAHRKIDDPGTSCGRAGDEVNGLEQRDRVA